MIIKNLKLSNFQIVRDFDADFEGGVYFITGDNEKGKSTILKAIGALLTGDRDAVLTNGEEKGFAKMVVGNDGENYDVELKFTKANPRGTLTIKSQTTGMKSDNLSMLQKIFGYTDFDAVEFSRWSETAEGRRKQIAVVKSLLPKEVQERITAIDKDVETKKELRKDINRDVKSFTAICETAEKELQPGDVKKYAKPIEIADLMAKQNENAQLIEKAKTVREKLKERTEQLAAIPGRIELINTTHKTTVDSLKKAAEDAKREYEQKLLDIQDKIELSKKSKDSSLEIIKNEKKDFADRKLAAEKWVKEYEATNPEKSDTAEQLKNSEEHNKKHLKVVQYQEKKKQKDEADKKADKFDKDINTLLKERETLISNSQLPIEGLSFTDDGLELNNVPFVEGKVSDSQIMEVAARLVIATNPTVKVFRIARGESLGKARLQAIIDIAKKNGFQGFIEEVKRGQDDLIVEEYSENE
jgi:DNA repair exonuclease SbcCD ATPase subunit